ncbi:MAG: transcriptional regulator with XRE-family HTH domain [Granulosicoccus sp.]|jgi:transcriptional regulator with XRE-family HTH domain
MFKPITHVAKGLAERCRKLRTQKKLSQQQLADRSGVSLGSLKRFESTGKISLESLLKIAVTLEHISEFENLLLPKEIGPKSIDELFNT